MFTSWRNHLFSNINGTAWTPLLGSRLTWPVPTWTIKMGLDYGNQQFTYHEYGNCKHIRNYPSEDPPNTNLITFWRETSFFSWLFILPPSTFNATIQSFPTLFCINNQQDSEYLSATWLLRKMTLFRISSRFSILLQYTTSFISPGIKYSPINFQSSISLLKLSIPIQLFIQQIHTSSGSLFFLFRYIWWGVTSFLLLLLLSHPLNHLHKQYSDSFFPQILSGPILRPRIMLGILLFYLHFQSSIPIVLQNPLNFKP